MDSILYYLDAAIVMWFITQVTFSFLVLVLGDLMVEYYEWGTYEQPSNGYQKTVNATMGFLIGAGPFVYKILLKYPWWKRKLFMMGFFFIFLFSSILTYQLLMMIVRIVF
ncbi:hypothetical protein [Mesobacillus subterraneus]|uniref:Uncharacterized protein n=1 Tax=Mesobacillus subterraneus TaxID=285983 RepID=A0A427TRE0_9BACI|nr:hypothetical protein [Mesobacillus subterraneus]RSD27004.1 hypothetical protein EJA10_10690 [Mesobacillus subterraneus]